MLSLPVKRRRQPLSQGLCYMIITSLRLSAARLAARSAACSRAPSSGRPQQVLHLPTMTLAQAQSHS